MRWVAFVPPPRLKYLSPVMPLCELCKQLPPVTEWAPETHHTYQALQQSANNGCEFCGILWETLDALATTERIMASEPNEVSVLLEYPPVQPGSPPGRVPGVNHNTYQYVLVSPSFEAEGGDKIGLFLTAGN